MGHHQRNVIMSNGNSVLMDQTQPPPPLIEQNLCFCSKFLNPFSTSFGNNHCLVTPNNLQHYCRVCNIQLNSCRQAKIHSEGKKHDKRLSYLRFCLESSDTSAAVAYLQNGAPIMETPPPNTMYPTTIHNGAGSSQSIPSVGQMTAPIPVVQSTTQQQPPSSAVPPPTIVQQQPCNIPPPQGAIYTGYSSVPPPVGPGTQQQLPPPPNVLSQNCSSSVAMMPPQPCSSSSMATAPVYQHQAMPSVTTTTTPYFYPQATTTSVTGNQVAQGALGYHSMPPPLQHHQTTYYDYTYMAPMISVDGNMSGQSVSNSQVASAPLHQPPPPLATPMNVYPPSTMSNQPPVTNNTYTTNSNGQVIFHCNVMSPSLTSGFSGSGGDCKSTETSSILSTASFSSNAMHYTGPHNHHNKKKGVFVNTGNVSNGDKMNNNGTSLTNGGSSGNKDGLINEKGFVAICEICRLPFPSQAVLENHLRGSRHARRVKSQQAFKQLHDNGAVFRHEEGVSEIRCEVCRVSVNSSHQLQAHLLGHKHRVRAVRRGVKPNQAIIIPSSSTDVTTTSPSGASSESGNESPPSQLAQETQQLPKHQKQKQQKKSQQLQQVNSQGVSTSGSLQRRRRSSAFIVPQNLSGPPTSSSSNTTTATGSTLDNTQLNRRHRSSGCLSKHCSHSTLSLSTTAFSQHRARSSSALNKVHSRSMNLLMLHNGGLTTSIRQDDSSSTDEGFDRDDRRKVKQRPRSYSTRTAKEGEAGTANRNDKSSTQAQQQKRSKSTKNYNNVEHHVKGILNSFVMKSQQKDKQQQSRHQKNLNKHGDASSKDQKSNNSSSLNNHSMRRAPNHNSTSIKPSKTPASTTTQSMGNAQSGKKTSNNNGSAPPNSKKLKNIPMLGVFLEGLNNNNGHHFPSNNKKNNQSAVSDANTRNNNNNNNNNTNNYNNNNSKISKFCETKKKQNTVLEKPQLVNGISTNGVTENNLTNNVAA